jgi:asparagine synthase (glutamine-hydrolysing)
MCGIFGIASPHPLPDPRPRLEGLTDLLRHRGPDARGSYMESKVFLGHRRLAVIDVRGGRQPMTACVGRFVIVYNGEIYNFRDVRNQLESRGHRFTSESDTEVVLRAYAEWGADCLSRLSGMFAFAIWDSSEQQLFLARDRLGIKPLYYALIGERLVFASEMKAITAHPDFRREADLAALSSYLSFRTVIGENSVFRGLKSFPPGNYLIFRQGRVRLTEYWDIPHSRSKTDKGEDYYLSATREILSRAVKRHLVSDVPLGAYLSGGLDSSLMVALMAETGSAPLRTYSIGFDAEGYDEGAYAAAASAHLGTEHCHLIFEAADFMTMMQAMIQHRDQPLSIPHEAALLSLSKELKKDVTVCLSGEGADELFGGYGRVQRSPMDYKKVALFRQLPAPLRALTKSLVRQPDLVQRLGLKDDVQHLFHVYHWWPFVEKWNIFSSDVTAELDDDRALQAGIHDTLGKVNGGDVYQRVFYFFEKFHLLNLLERLDMQSMAASVEARVPFVDQELVEFVSTIPVRYKMRWKSPLHMLRGCFMKSEHASEHLDISKYLLRRIADEKLPAQIARRKKLGFPVPLDAWFRGSLQKFAREILLDVRTRRRGIFNPVEIEGLLLNPQNAAYDSYGKKVWMLINVELWFRAHIDAAATVRAEPWRAVEVR